MSALAYRISVILLHSGAKSQDFTRLNRLGISMSHKSTIAKQKEMAKEHDSLVLTWKNEIETVKKCESLLQEVKEKQVPVPVETSDENDMEIDVYDLNQSTLASYDFFSQESYEICKDNCLFLHKLSPLLLLKWPFLLQQINPDYYIL